MTAETQNSRTARQALVLAGPPGVGKSTVGAAAAAQLGLPSWDLDALIEAKTGRQPADIIRTDGEASFREVEVQTLMSQLGQPGVLALGGGTLTTAPGRRAARQVGPVLGLEATQEILQKRLTASQAIDRPLNAEGLDTLLDKRALSYRAVDRRIDAAGSVGEVAAKVVDGARSVTRLEARVGPQRTRVVVGTGLEHAPAGAIAHLDPQRPVLALVDLGVPEVQRRRLLDPIRALFTVHEVELEGGEGIKTWASAGRVLDTALAAGCGRQSVVVALGGGATCDLAGLAAHLLGRGAELVLIPSTLLSQVDASVGGKCAVNMAAGRNLVGAFHAASDVIADAGLLESLSDEEYRSGLAELLKMAIIGDEDLFEQVIASGRASAEMIARGIALKAEIVGRDPFEKGERRTLNLGHTLGHALETASNHRLRHGEAVAIGIAAMARWSAAQGWTSPDEAERIVRGLQRTNLPTFADPALLRDAGSLIGTDKKSTATEVALVSIHKVARVSVQTLSLAEAREGLVRHGGHR